ncbi:glycosyltransferase family 22 protein [Hydnum rufescens UP504]|uniref:Mannosyltransferase n=1 Tax=Hydnum rufescens UP504 TaxID=1448309 RepID=A0A9P6AGW2_9AGAM|nr:glycosyltransferase family 22 protein [Hydnum rufescens UP504]
MRIVLWLPIVIRLVLSLLTRTFFAPDEFYQSLEPAHHAVFGYGYLTWEWVSSSPIRSFTYPALFVPFYHTLRLLCLDHTYTLMWAPKLLHGSFAALTDISTFLLAEKTIGPNYAFTALFLSLTSFYNVLVLLRHQQLIQDHVNGFCVVFLALGSVVAFHL